MMSSYVIDGGQPVVRFVDGPSHCGVPQYDRYMTMVETSRDPCGHDRVVG